MQEKYIIGIDVGSQSAKVYIFDLEGNIIAEGREKLRAMYMSDPGIVEHPDDDLWDALCAAGQKVMNNFTGRPDRIIGIGLGGIRCCRVLLKEDGMLAAPVISWMDDRTSRPYEHADPDVAYVTSVSGYLGCRLTGAFKDCIGNNFGQWPVDYDKWDWSEDEDMQKQYNLPRKMLFDPVLPGSVLGMVTEEAHKAAGFPKGIPVVCTTSDKAVEGLGSGLVNDETAVISLGTYITLMIQGEKMPEDPKALWAILSSIPYKYIYESYGIRRGMWTVSWFRDLFGEGLIREAAGQGLTPEELLNKKAEAVPPGSDGLMTVLDWLANALEPYKRGVMIGFGAHMNEAFMYRSILEGIAYTMKNNCDAMCGELGKELNEIVISGGGSGSDLFMQIFADVFNLPAKRNVMNGSAGIGAAINTAVAIGEYSNYEEAVKHMVKVRDVFYPIKENVELYHRLNKQVYCNITKHTDEVLKATYEILNK